VTPRGVIARAAYYSETNLAVPAITALRTTLAQAEEPPRREPLTEEEIDALCMDGGGLPRSHLEFARAIERAHGIGDSDG